MIDLLYTRRACGARDWIQGVCNAVCQNHYTPHEFRTTAILAVPLHGQNARSWSFSIWTAEFMAIPYPLPQGGEG